MTRKKPTVRISVLADVSWLAEIRRLIHTAPFLIVGDSSFYLPKTRDRVIMESAALDYRGEIDTPPAHARHTLERLLPEYRRPIWRKGDTTFFRLATPLYFAGETRGDYGQYVDIRAAYNSMYSLLALDDLPLCVNYNPTGLLWHIGQELKPEKRIRNCVVGLCHSGPLQAYKAGKYVPIFAKNRWYSPAVWYNIQYTLHYLAGKARDNGACYAHTDGFIFPDVVPDGFIDELERLGMQWRVKADGQFHVKGLGGYAVGKVTSLAYSTIKTPRPFCNIRDVRGVDVYNFWERARQRTFGILHAQRTYTLPYMHKEAYTGPVWESPFDAPRMDEVLHPCAAAGVGMRM